MCESRRDLGVRRASGKPVGKLAVVRYMTIDTRAHAAIVVDGVGVVVVVQQIGRLFTRAVDISRARLSIYIDSASGGCKKSAKTFSLY